MAAPVMAPTPANRRTDASTTLAAGNRADNSSGAGLDQTTANHAICGTVWSAEAVVANNSPAPITLTIVDRFLISSTHNATEPTNKWGMQFRSLALPPCDRDPRGEQRRLQERAELIRCLLAPRLIA